MRFPLPWIPTPRSLGAMALNGLALRAGLRPTVTADPSPWYDPAPIHLDSAVCKSKTPISKGQYGVGNEGIRAEIEKRHRAKLGLLSLDFEIFSLLGTWDLEIGVSAAGGRPAKTSHAHV